MADGATLRQLYVSLGLNADKGSFAQGLLLISGIRDGLQTVVNIGRQVLEFFPNLIGQTAQYGAGVLRISQTTGVATDSIQRLGIAAGQEGIDIDQLSLSLVRLSRTTEAASEGQDEAGQAFSKLGIHVRDSSGKLKTADTLFGDIAEKFQKMPDGVTKTALAMKLFGRAGAQMIPLLNQGREGLEAFSDAPIMSREQLESAREFERTMAKLTYVGQQLWRSVFAPMLPAITELTKKFLAWRKANAEAFSRTIQKHMETFISIIHGIGKAFDVLVNNLDVVKFGLAAAITAIAIFKIYSVGAAVATAAAWLLALAPIVAIGAAFSAVLLVINSFRRAKEGRDSLVGDWLHMIDEWKQPNANDPWWLRAFKELVIEMDKALGLAEELGIKSPRNQDRPVPGGMEKLSNFGRVVSAPMRALQNSILPDFDWKTRADARADEAMAQTGSYWESLKATIGVGKYGGFQPQQPMQSSPQLMYTPNYPTPRGDVTVHMSVTQLPGESGEDFSNRVAEIIKSERDSTHEDAQAALSQ